MAEMSKGLDTLLSKLKQAESLSAKIEKSWEGFNKAVTSGASAASKIASAGGQKAIGAGKSMMTSSFGNVAAMPSEGVAPTFGNTTTGLAKKSVNRLGLGEFKLDSTDAEYAAAREGVQSRVMARYGINKSSYDQMSGKDQQIVANGMFGPADSIDLMTGMQKAFNTFMPSVSQSIGMAGTYYNAAVSNAGQSTRKELQSLTYNAMSGGMTSVGSDAATAEFLMGRGMSTSGQSKNTYLETLSSISNAAKYMNINNQAAAASIEGMTSGSGAGNMLKQLGIYTADLTTGKEKTQTQIFEEVAQRLTAGRASASTEQTQNSIRRGALGATIKGLFQDTTTQQMFQQYMIDRTKGGAGKDLGSMLDQGMGSKERNPLNAQLTMNASDTNALAKAQDGYISGMEAAIGPLQALNTAAGGLAVTMGSVNAMMETLMAHNTTQGLVGGISSIAKYGGKYVSGVTEALMNLNPGTPAVIGALTGSAVAGLAPVAAGAAATALTGIAGNASSWGGGPGVTFTGVMGGSGNIGGTGASAPTGTITQGWASVSHKELYGGNAHDGVDYDRAYDEPVYAVADGEVTLAKGNATGLSKKDAWKSVTKYSSLGNHVKILHSNGYTSIYGHLNKVLVTQNQKVKKGQQIGTAGNSGYTGSTAKGGFTQASASNPTSGTHLHLGMEDPSHKLVNPIEAIVSIAKNDTPAGPTVPGSSDTTGTQTADQRAAAAQQTAADQAFAASGIVNSAMKSANSGSSLSNAIGLLTNLYSGDSSKILGAIQSMASNVGITNSAFSSFQGLGTNLAGAAAANLLSPPTSPVVTNPPAAGVSPTPTASSGGNNIVINVQVPDVTQSDAMKFAELVKQYLDANTLMSNTGSV